MSSKANGSAEVPYPNERQFAFTIIDDTDVATLDNIRPLYDLLTQLGMRTTKTVWPLDCPEGSRNFSTSETLEDDDYKQYILELLGRGFEITWHAATMESSKRERTLLGLERFKEVFGDYPRLHCNHAENREGIYWGVARVDDRLLKRIVRLTADYAPDYYCGHLESSPYWWGDICHQHFEYVRNLTFNQINTLRINPTMPYQDPRRPHGRWWFSTSDVEDAKGFCRLISKPNLDRLEREGGACILSTHLGKGFVTGGRVLPEVEDRLAAVAERPGWFVPATPLLDFLREKSSGSLLAPDASLPKKEWRRMQWRWFADSVWRRLVG